LDAPGRTGQKDIQVGGGHVELHGLVVPGQLELGDAFARGCLTVAPAGPAEVVQHPL
jgi:hypothetical protein